MHQNQTEHTRPIPAVEQTEALESTAGERSAPRPKQRRGFAAMDPAKRRSIASLGGKASHARGTGHKWSAEEAREAGRKGGRASRGGRGKLQVEPAAR
jgi:general stress protein YciG